jgi:hypothetical protein
MQVRAEAEPGAPQAGVLVLAPAYTPALPVAGVGKRGVLDILVPAASFGKELAFEGLAKETAYTFTAVAVCGGEEGAASAATVAVNTAAATKPAIAVVRGSWLSVVLVVSKPAGDYGNHVEHCVVRCSPSGTMSDLQVPAASFGKELVYHGLAKETAYTFTVAAVCGGEEGAASAATDAVATTAPVALTHVSDFDTNGYMHYKGTQGNTQAYENPQRRGAVRTNRSSEGPSGDYAAHRLVQGEECDGKGNCTGGYEPGQWMSVDLLNGDALEVNHYCLRHGGSNDYNRLCFWELQGRAGDGADWETLSKHTDDRALGNGGFATAGWVVERGGGGLSQFRVLQTGKNSDGYSDLRCAGLELYGTLLPGA